MKQLLIFSLLACLFSSCDKTEITNNDLRNMVPGGIVTTSLSSSEDGTFSLVNDTFPSYGFSCHKGTQGDGYYFNIRVSGEKNGMIYYFLGSGSLSQPDMDFIQANPDLPFSLYSVGAEVEIKNGSSVFYTTKHPPVYRVPGIITVSNFGEVGEPVTVSFNFQTSSIAGFSDMAGTVSTRYVIYQY